MVQGQRTIAFLICYYLKEINMFNIFKKSTEEEQLQKKYQKLMEMAFLYSKSNRRLSDQKAAEANKVLLQIEKLKKKN